MSQVTVTHTEGRADRTNGQLPFALAQATKKAFWLCYHMFQKQTRELVTHPSPSLPAWDLSRGHSKAGLQKAHCTRIKLHMYLFFTAAQWSEAGGRSRHTSHSEQERVKHPQESILTK